RTKPLPARVAGVVAADRVVSWQPNPEKDVRGYAIYKKGFLGVAQKLADVKETRWRNDDRGKVELYITAVDGSGLESEPSETVTFE
ncbi:MAG TPA: hypothetical protein VIH45_07130, partial [Desulfuromonadaceae bacterium]